MTSAQLDCKFMTFNFMTETAVVLRKHSKIGSEPFEPNKSDTYSGTKFGVK